MRRRDVLAGAGSLAAGATASFPAPAIAQGIRQLTMVTDWPESMPGLLPTRAGWRRRSGKRRGAASRSRCSPPTHWCARSRPSTRSRQALPTCTTPTTATSRRSRWHSTSIAAFRSASPPMNCSPGCATEAARSCGMRSPASSTSSRSTACSTGTQMGGWFNNEITSLDRFKGLRYRMPGLGARDPATARRHRGQPARRRDRPGAQVRRHRCQRVDRAVARHGHRPSQGRRLLLLPGLPRAGHGADARHQQAGLGEPRCRRPAADRGLRRRRVRAVRWRSSTPTMPGRCASCATKAPSRS